MPFVEGELVVVALRRPFRACGRLWAAVFALALCAVSFLLVQRRAAQWTDVPTLPPNAAELTRENLQPYIPHVELDEMEYHTAKMRSILGSHNVVLIQHVVSRSP